MQVTIEKSFDVDKNHAGSCVFLVTAQLSCV